MKIGHYTDASKHLEMLRQKLPDDPELETLLARSEYDMGQRAEAIYRLDELLRRHPEHEPALRERGRFALAAKEYAQAEQWLQKAVDLWPYDYDAQWGLQQALQALERKEDANARRVQALQLRGRQERISAIQMHDMPAKPSDPALHCELGVLFLAIGERGLGERWLHSALRLDPSMSAAHAALADQYEKAGDAERAQQHRRLVTSR